MLKLGFLLFLSIFVLGDALRAIENHLSSEDSVRLQQVFVDGIKSNDLQAIYFSALNLKELSAQEKSNVCERLLSLHGESKLNEFEKNFYLVGASKLLSCSSPVPAAILSTVKSSLAKDTTTAHELYYNYFSNKYAGNAVDDATKTRIATNLQTILKADDSLSNLGHAFNIAAELGTKASTLSKWIEGTIAQADEINGKQLQFEGGLSITALIINGVLKFSKAVGGAAPLTEDQQNKFITYFLSRSVVLQPKGASLLLEVLSTIATDRKTAPIGISFIGNGQVFPEAQELNIQIVDILGEPVQPAISSVTGSITSKADNSVLGSNLAFTPRSSDRTAYSLNLKSLKLKQGTYTIDIKADTYTQTLVFKVLTQVKVASLEIGIGESDSSSAIQKHTVAYPQKLNVVLNADQQQKILVKALLVDEITNSPITVHQAFVLFEDDKKAREVIFVAEQDTSKAYKFDLDVGARAVYFQHKSGVYSLELIVGDSSISNSFRWHLADIELKFHEVKEQSASNVNQSRTPKPEIIHQFREPEKRPPRFVSDVFTVLCAVPLVVLFFLWIKLGVNVSNFSFSLSGIGFFLSFGGILTLFGLFWYQLNMFETLGYLIPLAISTFVFGNRFLQSIARKQSEHKKTELIRSPLHSDLIQLNQICRFIYRADALEDNHTISAIAGFANGESTEFNLIKSSLRPVEEHLYKHVIEKRRKKDKFHNTESNTVSFIGPIQMKGGYKQKFNIFVGFLDRSFSIYRNQLQFFTVLVFTFLIAIYSIMANKEVNVTNLAEGISKFSAEFYQECTKSTGGDVIISPLSVASALGLLAQGANGKTFDELCKGLHLTHDKETQADQFAVHYESLQKSIGESTLSIANQLYVQAGYEIKKHFQEVAVKKFSSGIDSLNFAQSAESAATINRFVEQKTNKKIKDLIKPEMLDAVTRLVLVNAIYFKGNWEHKFDPKRTTQGDFYVSETETVPVDYMHIKKKFNYAVLDEFDATALEMKYVNSNFSFVVVLPNERTGLSALEDKLQNYDLAKITDKMHRAEVDVTIPKFKVEYEINLNDALKNMGMADMFGQQADLSGLLESNEPLYVSDVVHKAFIEVNEEGAEAAAATAVVSRKKRSLNTPIAFEAAHPFFYFISSLESTISLPIFLGSLLKPITDSYQMEHDEL
ncbi:dolichyl-diphosphooligosaccharide--protein glycosyltransferase subunit 2 [Contarinia nasturtii]|uniref:dolichyl-diphosphooligosaccharide--protein glycosyltransferase subunit 2 n=1 Tax=Contarinia nasturtii TaxID=265458 RepID=UPI0012D450E0|nr:dolichyl-diphosphooligosaccharide--protein glycosyltransferase subunit 2 [Contarinia nasturtii]